MPSASATITEPQPKKRSDRIAASNWCTMFFYNIPRASLMITVPGLVVLVTGAAMVAFADHDQPWTSGLSQIALICLCVGGVLTLGGLVFWFVAWFRYKPPLRKDSQAKKNSVAPPMDDATGVQMQAVYTYPTEQPVQTVAASVESNAVGELPQADAPTYEDAISVP